MPRLRPRARAVLLLAGISIPAGGSAQLPVTEPPVVELSVEDVRDGLASGRFTAVELTRGYLARIERYERRYNAFISLVPDALDVAAALDREYATTGPRGPLHGVPVVIKDNIDYAGIPTTAGWEGFNAASGGIDMVPGDDAVSTRTKPGSRSSSAAMTCGSGPSQPALVRTGPSTSSISTTRP
jgi:hypothetical protein